MFPEISRDDIFRLETRQLWLRWPTAGDAVPARDAAMASSAMPEDTTGDPYRAPAVLDAWRDGNAAGTELHLLLTGRGPDRRVTGAVELVPVRGQRVDCGLKLRTWVAPAWRGRGFATEAVQAAVDMAFLLTETPLVAASARVLDPAFRRVLEKCGFGSCGTGVDPAADGRGLTASDRFRLDRKAWLGLEGWRRPAATRGDAGRDPGLCCAT